MEVFWQASNWYHSLQLPGPLWPHWTHLARVRTVPFSTSFLLETIYWHFGLRKDENRSYCEIQMLFTGGGGLVTESVRLCATPWTRAHQAPLSMGTLQARILEWVAILVSRDLPNPSIKTASAALQVDSLLLSHQGSPRKQKVIESKWTFIGKFDLFFRICLHFVAVMLSLQLLLMF